MEDQRRLISEWKDKADIDGPQLGRFVLGKIYQFRKEFAQFCENDPDFREYKVYRFEDRDEVRRQVNILLVKILRRFNFTTDNYDQQFWKQAGIFEAVGTSYPDVATKIAVHCFLYAKTILTLGNQSHIKYAQRAFEAKDMGCFGLTEIAHGSNVQGCITTAVYDDKKEEFIINTPSERGAKFWIGNAAQTANMSVIFANLLVKGKDYGIHAFIVPLRSSNNTTQPGVIINDCGDKMGAQGIDNGMIMFRNVRIPRTNLLDKVTQVAPDGTVTSVFAQKSKRFAVQLAALSDGRVKIGIATCSQALVPLTIALRYAAVRRQFGQSPYDENQILNYPLVQSKLLPLYAKAVINYFAALKIGDLWNNNIYNIFDPKNVEVQEMHALVSIIKPLASWNQIAATLTSRAVCGGLGYSAYSRLGQIHSDYHVNVTWEGDNTVLLQQTARFILKGLGQIAKGKPVQFKSLYYLNMDDLSEKKLLVEKKEDFKNLEIIQSLIEFMALKSAQDGAMAIQLYMASSSSYDAWNQSLPFELNNASKLYGELYCHNTAKEAILNCSVKNNSNFLMKLLLIKTLTLAKEYSSYLLDFMSAK
jgi:acyl-CoA oxidase